MNFFDELGRGCPTKHRLRYNGFKVQWEAFLRHVAEDAPWNYSLAEGAKGGATRRGRAYQSWRERAAGSTCPDLEDLSPIKRRFDFPAARSPSRRGRCPSPPGTGPGSPIPPSTSSADPLADAEPWSTAPSTGTLDAGVPRAHLVAGTRGRRGDGTPRSGGMGLDWPTSLELIRKSVAQAKTGGHLIASGAGTDHLAPGPEVTIDDVIAAVRGGNARRWMAAGSRVILWRPGPAPPPHAAPRLSPPVIIRSRCSAGCRSPRILHWLGEMFEPRARRLLGQPRSHRRRWTTCLSVIDANATKVDGIKDFAFYRRKRRVRDAPPPARRRAHVYRRRFQLSRPHRRRLRRGIRMPFWAPSTRSRGAASRALSALAAGDMPGYPAPPSIRRSASRATSSAPPPGSTRPAWCSRPISPATRTTFTMVGGQESARSNAAPRRDCPARQGRAFFTDPRTRRRRGLGRSSPPAAGGPR